MVLHVSPVHEMEYYDAVAEDVGRLIDRAKRALIRERRGLKDRRDGLGYYDHGAEAGIGTFERLCRGDPDPRSLFAELHTGMVAETTVIRRIADRRHPRTGRNLQLQHQKRWLKHKQKHARQVVGHDIQINAPKDVGVLWAFASQPLRALIAAAHHRAVSRALAFIHENRLIEARSGQDGWRREPVADALIARYFHTLSRANDPHLHTHSVLMNLCQRADGSIGTVDTGRVVAFGSAMTELYRAELASILHRELGLEIKKEAHGFSLPAIPEAVVTLFSKRRIAIEEEAEARGFEPGKDRKAAQKTSYDTRRSKVKGVTAEILRAGWEEEARQIGHDPDSFMLPIEAVVLNHTPSPSRPHTLAKHDLDRLIETAYAHDAKLNWPDLLAHVARQVQIEANVDEAIAVAEALRERLIALPGHDRGEPVYTCAAIVKTEHDLLKRAVDGRSRWAKLAVRQVEEALKAFPTLLKEQHAAVRHALNRDRVCVVNGSAGSGKSFMSFSIARVAEQHGLRVIGTSAAWTAAQVLRREAGIATENTFSLAKLMAEIAKGRLALDDRTVIIVDEAGMAPLTVIADLIRIADDAGAKIVLIGDVRQLQPVASGAPMRALASELGFAEMIGIRRQRHDWMREASIDLAAHRPDHAVDAYDRAGCLAVHVDREGTLAAAAEDYVRQAADDPMIDALSRQLLITPRNRDVAELNRLVRERLQAAGRLGPDLVRVKALPRGKQEGSEPVTIPLAVGDRIVFGARLELRSRTIFNSDVARIMAINAHPTDPRLTFVLNRTNDDGQPLSFMVRYSELVSLFSDASVPELQHAYAMTAYGSQGATVERAVLVDIDGLSAEAGYVGMTRHRERLSIHLSAEKSLSRHRREVFRLSRRNELVDDEAPVRTTVTLTKEERDAAVALAKARMRRPHADSNPSSHVHDKAAWLASDDPVGEFQRQIERRGGRGGIGRMTPEAPEIAASSDATILSKAEIHRLDAIPLNSDPVLRAFQLSTFAPSRLRHNPSGITINLAGNRPDWSDNQRQELARRRALQDHPLVQIAILLLKKPLRWARAWVRRVFGLSGLNPLAAAAHTEDRRILKRQEAVEAEAPGIPRVQTAATAIDERNTRRQRRYRRWRTMAQAERQHTPELSTSAENEERAARRTRRSQRWHALERDYTVLGAEHGTAAENEDRAERRARRFAFWASRDAAAAQLVASSPVPEESLEITAATAMGLSDIDRHRAGTAAIDETPQPPSSDIAGKSPAPFATAGKKEEAVDKAAPSDHDQSRVVRPEASKGGPAAADNGVMASPKPVRQTETPSRPLQKIAIPRPRPSTEKEMDARVEAKMITREIAPTLQSDPRSRGSATDGKPLRPCEPDKFPPSVGRSIKPTISLDAKKARDEAQASSPESGPSPGSPKKKQKSRFWQRLRKTPERDRD